MTVFVVKKQHDSLDDSYVAAIFSTKEKAKEYAETENQRTYYYDIDITEYELDSGDWV